jgi:hypothetical protein
MKYIFTLSLVLASALLAGCVTNDYVRTDGGQINTAQERAMLAQCKGEGATAAPAADPYHNLDRTVTEACMARNGYIRSSR